MTLQVAPPDVATPQDAQAAADSQSGWLVVAERSRATCGPAAAG